MLLSRTVIPEGLKSGPSLQKILVRFINRSQKRIDVMWINYDGTNIIYSTLSPNSYFNIDTFVGHPWVFRNNVSWDRMDVCKNEVFYPEQWHVNMNIAPNETKSHLRKPILITLPVYSLREICFQVVRQSLSTKNEIFQLDVPSTLQNELFDSSIQLDEQNNLQPL